ncbi:MAG TPA: MarR family winged helix-turn-helix transcriptional regulator [Burkholderiales bacterium]|jgi:DNA-binding MarR family transcriptional regulator|nr:MarR family winged helix-turn-helix transcriptional regulator [Burkholderiales bacterium]
MTQLYDACLAPFGLTVNQFSILSRLRRTGPRSINTLAREMLVDRTTLGRNVRPLEREGLLELAPDEADKRSWALTLTPAGVKRVETAREGWKKAQQRFEQAYGAERAADLRRLLNAAVETELSVDGKQHVQRHRGKRSK